MFYDKWGRGRFDAGPFREDILAAIIKEREYSKIAELGVFDGYTMMTILKDCPMVEELVGIDTWADPSTYECLAPKGEKSRLVYETVDHEINYALTLKNIEEYKDRYTLLRITTKEASLLFEDGYFDLVFIDADHSYEGVKQDIIDWSPKVKVGGSISGHDISWAGVRQAVQEEIGLERIKIFTDDVWMCEKK